MKKTLVYIASSPRSGSTLMTNLLGNHPRIFNVGELCNIHSYLNGGRIGRYFEGLCSCGEPIRECPVWGGVIASAMEKCGVSESDFITRILDIGAVPKLGRFASVQNQTERLLSFSEHDSTSVSVGRHCYALLDGIVESQCVSVVVDSSKNVSNLAVYLRNKPDDWEVKVIHILRDPRATATSMIKGCKRAGVTVPSFYRASLGWLRVNRLLHGIVQTLPVEDSLTFGFEAFCAKPQQVLLQAEKILGLELKLSDLSEHSGLRHDIGGSRSVSTEVGRIDIRLDRSWKNEMNCFRKWFSALSTMGMYKATTSQL